MPDQVNNSPLTAHNSLCLGGLKSRAPTRSLGRRCRPPLSWPGLVSADQQSAPPASQGRNDPLAAPEGGGGVSVTGVKETRGRHGSELLVLTVSQNCNLAGVSEWKIRAEKGQGEWKICIKM